MGSEGRNRPKMAKIDPAAKEAVLGRQDELEGPRRRSGERQLLSSWVCNPRPRGAPLMTFGRSINKDLREAGLELDGWYELAQDRALWRAVVRHLAPPGETTNNNPHTQTTTNQPSS